MFKLVKLANLFEEIRSATPKKALFRIFSFLQKVMEIK